MRIERLSSAFLSAQNRSESQIWAIRALIALGATPLAGGAAPFDERQYRLGARQEGVGGYVPGRDPTVRSELVVIRTRLEDPRAAVLLEAMRVLVLKSKTANVPGRSVLIVLTPESRDATIASLWPRSHVYARVELVEGPAESLLYQIASSTGDTTVVRSGTVEPVQQAADVVGMALRLASPVDTLASRRAQALENE